MCASALSDARKAQRLGKDTIRNDGHHGRARESGERLARGEDARDAQGHHDQQGHQVGAQALTEQECDRHEDDRRRNNNPGSHNWAIASLTLPPFYHEKSCMRSHAVTPGCLAASI